MHIVSEKLVGDDSREYPEASSDLWVRVCLHVCEWVWDVSEYEPATFQEFYVCFLIQSVL